MGYKEFPDFQGQWRKTGGENLLSTGWGMWEVKKNIMQQIIDNNMLKEVRLREVIPVKQRKRHSATMEGNKKGFEFAVVA